MEAGARTNLLLLWTRTLFEVTVPTDPGTHGMVAFYPIVIGAVLAGWIGPWVLLVVLGIPRLLSVLRTVNAPRPEVAPQSYVGWPLWFVGAAFIHTR